MDGRRAIRVARSSALRHLRRLHPILRQHEQLTLLGPDMAFEQDAETVDLVVRAGLVTELHLTWN